MHRLSTLPGGNPDDPLSFVEQPSAEVLFLSSAGTDLSALARTLEESSSQDWDGRIRALPLDALNHPAQIDHYLSICTSRTRLIVVRLLGGRGHSSYV